MARRLLVGVLLLGLAAPAMAQTRHAAPAATRPRHAAPSPAEPRLLMSWAAPYGVAGARENVDPECDTTLVDTLYLSVDPGRRTDHFLGVSATLYFHAPEGESLTEFWKIGDIHRANSPLKVVFTPDSTRGFAMAWNMPGVGDAEYDFVGGSGRLRMIYAMASGGTNPVRPGQVYGVARVLIRHPASGASGCARAMCVEWHDAALAFGPRDEPQVNRGIRWVSLNSAGAKVCAPLREILAPPAWKPPTPKP